jgi:release factor glutamine methyltransferase
MNAQAPAAVRSIVAAAADRLAAAGIESARLDAELLMAEAAGVARAQVAAESVELSPEALERYRGYLARRAAREPLAYIVGHKEFFSLGFTVTPAALIPRPETEILAAAALEFIAGRAHPRVLDLGTGCGAIAVAIAVNAPDAVVVATDLSKATLELAGNNAARLGCRDRIEFRLGDCWDALAGENVKFDLVVSNPPYIETAAIAGLEPEISKFEPLAALCGGPDGLDCYRRIVGGVRAFLAPGGALMVEVGAGQADSVMQLCRDAGCGEVAAIRDLARIPRVVSARF